MKIICINEKNSVAFSGAVDTARNIIIELKIKLNYESLHEALRSNVRDNPSLKEFDTKLIFLIKIEDGTKILVWDNQSLELIEPSESLSSMGSLDEKVRSQVENFLKFFFKVILMSHTYYIAS